jgi:dynein heavy chain
MRDPPEGEDIPEGVDIADLINATKVYEPLYDKEKILTKIFEFTKKYNEDPVNKSQAKFDLVLFDSCVQHILRVSRIIRTPRGHALLVGVGGSGK